MFVLLVFLGCLSVFDAHLTSTDAIPNVARFQCLFLRFLELLVLFDGGQPETQHVGVVVTVALRPVALYER